MSDYLNFRGDYVDVFEIIFSYLTEKEYLCIIINRVT